MLLEAIAIIAGLLIGLAVLIGLAAVLEKFNIIIDLLEILLGLEEPKEYDIDESQITRIKL